MIFRFEAANRFIYFSTDFIPNADRGCLSHLYDSPLKIAIRKRNRKAVTIESLHQLDMHILYSIQLALISHSEKLNYRMINMKERSHMFVVRSLLASSESSCICRWTKIIEWISRSNQHLNDISNQRVSVWFRRSPLLVSTNQNKTMMIITSLNRDRRPHHWTISNYTSQLSIEVKDDWWKFKRSLLELSREWTECRCLSFHAFQV